jgi:hypothetical protein
MVPVPQIVPQVVQAVTVLGTIAASTVLAVSHTITGVEAIAVIMAVAGVYGGAGVASHAVSALAGSQPAPPTATEAPRVP